MDKNKKSIPAGTVLFNENGIRICDMAKDLPPTTAIIPSHFTNWSAEYPEPVVGAAFPNWLYSALLRARDALP